MVYSSWEIWNTYETVPTRGNTISLGGGEIVKEKKAKTEKRIFNQQTICTKNIYWLWKQISNDMEADG